MSDETAKTRLWAAVHSITEPTRQRVIRVSDDYLDELDGELARISAGRGGVCSVSVRHRMLARLGAATRSHGRVPSLWAEANWAVFGSEAGDGSGGKTSARERTPADLDLMETLLTIRESLGWQLPGRHIPWRRPGDIPDMMRQLAGHIASNEPQHVEWWAFRFEQWARLLRTHLNALDQGPKPRYLRNSTCPNCRATQVAVGDEGERRVVPALVVDFTRDGLIRAAECQACGHAWWRGDDLGHLAEQLDTSDPGGMMTA